MNEVRMIADYQAIANVKARYCRMLDTKDWAGFLDVFTEDLVLDVSAAGGSATPIRGREAAIASVRASIETARTAHQVHSPEITLNGDEAAVIWAMQDRVVWSSERSITGYGHYHERYVRIGGVWKIAATRLTRLHVDTAP